MSEQHQKKQNRTEEYESYDFISASCPESVDDWNSAELFDSDQNSNPIQGIIVARMPDLGECRSLSDQERSKSEIFVENDESSDSQSSESDFSSKALFFKRIAFYSVRWTSKILPRRRNREENSESNTSDKRTLKPYGRFILAGIVLLICGIALISWSKKDKGDGEEIAAATEVQTEEPVKAKPNKKPAPATPPAPKTDDKKPVAPPAPKADDKKAAAPPAPKADNKKAAATPAPKADDKKAAAPPAPKADDKKAAATPAPKADDKKAVAPPAPKADDKKAAAPPAPKADDKKPATAPATKTDVKKPAVTPATKTDVKKPATAPTGTDPNSPWDRAATDNYSPWTMTASNRLEGASEKPKENKDEKAAVPSTEVATASSASSAADPGAVNTTIPTAAATPTVATVLMPAFPAISTATSPTASPATSPIPMNPYPRGTAIQPGMHPGVYGGTQAGTYPPGAMPVQGNMPGGYASSSQFASRSVPQQYPASSPMPHAATPQGQYAGQYTGQYTGHPVAVRPNPTVIQAGTSAPSATGRIPLAESHATYQGTSIPAAYQAPVATYAGSPQAGQGAHYAPSSVRPTTVVPTPNYVAVSPQAPYPTPNPNATHNAYVPQQQRVAATNPNTALPMQQPYQGGVAQPTQYPGVNGAATQQQVPANNGQTVAMPPYYQQGAVPQTVPTGRYY